MGDSISSIEYKGVNDDERMRMRILGSVSGIMIVPKLTKKKVEDNSMTTTNVQGEVTMRLFFQDSNPILKGLKNKVFLLVLSLARELCYIVS
jgi:hypothetical protein